MTRWMFLPIGYVLSVLVECPVLLFGLSPRHSLAVKLFASFWLTACTYPIVILVMPVVVPDRYYLLVAEILPPLRSAPCSRSCSAAAGCGATWWPSRPPISRPFSPACCYSEAELAAWGSITMKVQCVEPVRRVA